MDGLEIGAAISTIVKAIEAKGIGKGKINYRMRDAGFSRQRYWGEPFPVVYKDEMPYTLPESELPVTLPDVESFKPTGDGDSPLARNTDWVNHPDGPRETDTMPGYAGSSWYFLRYMDPHNGDFFVGKDAVDYWQNVDLYVGGAEHAVGHLLYSRFWHKFFFDKGWVPTQEPYKKLVNQGMIQGRSNFVYRINGTNKFVSLGLKDQYETIALHVDVNIVDNDVLDVEAFKNWLEDYKSAEFVLEDGKYICGWEVEKMSKSKYNVTNPDNVIEKYGADTFRMYEMFLGPIEQSKPWITNGLDGVHKFLRKFWRLFYTEQGLEITDEAPTAEELKVLHRTIKKIQEDVERLSFNTCISAFMIATNELTDLKCRKRAILKELVVLLAPFAPHIAEELWSRLRRDGESETVVYAPFPVFNPAHLVESNFNYPVSINGKVRATIDFPLDYTEDQVKPEVLANEQVQKWLEGKDPKKFIFVKGRIINVVV